MITAAISRLILLLLGFVYPAYSSYKAVRGKNVKEYVRWMMYWIVLAFLTCVETITDILLSWFPFYYEIKIILVLWLLSPWTKGSSTLYRKFIHPMLTSREQEIDEYINQAKEKGYTTVLQLGSKGVNYATNVIMQTALKKLQIPLELQAQGIPSTSSTTTIACYSDKHGEYGICRELNTRSNLISNTNRCDGNNKTIIFLNDGEDYTDTQMVLRSKSLETYETKLYKKQSLHIQTYYEESSSDNDYENTNEIKLSIATDTTNNNIVTNNLCDENENENNNNEENNLEEIYSSSAARVRAKTLKRKNLVKNKRNQSKIAISGRKKIKKLKEPDVEINVIE